MLADKDRIFTNLYGYQPWNLKSAQARGSFGMNDHLRPVGKPAPPRPRRPDALISSMIASWPRWISALVLSQSPRAWADFRFHG